MSAVTRIRRLYETAYDDEYIIRSVLCVIQDIRNNTAQFPDDSSMGLYCVGDVRAIKGFWASRMMVEELISALTGRSLRHCMTTLNLESKISPEDLVGLVKWTGPQTKRCIRPILKSAIEIHGQPDVIDHEKVADLASRASRLLNSVDPSKLD